MKAKAEPMTRIRIKIAENVRQYSTYTTEVNDALASTLCDELISYTRSLYRNTLDPRIEQLISDAEPTGTMQEPGHTPEYAYQVAPAIAGDTETNPEYALVAETGREGDRDITTWALIRENGGLTAYPLSSAGTALSLIIAGELENMSEATDLFYAALESRDFDDDMSEPESDEGPFPYLAWTPMGEK